MKKSFVGSSILFFLTLSVFVACSPDIEKKYKLKTSTPFSYDHFCNFDSLSGYSKYPRTYEYDTVKKQRVYIFDSIPEGEVTLTFFFIINE